MWTIFFYGGDVGFERDVVERLRERLEVGCEKKVSFKYIGVSIRQRGERVMMSQDIILEGLRSWRDGTLREKEDYLRGSSQCAILCWNS